jgi:hypothetical protein
MTSCIRDFRLRWQFPAAEATWASTASSAEEMMDGVEPDQPFDDQIDGDDDVEEPRHDQNENAGNQRDDRRDFGGGDDHDLPRSWIDLGAIAQVRAEIDKLSTLKAPFGSSMAQAFGNRRIRNIPPSFRGRAPE